MSSKSSRLVYSTESGKVCPECEEVMVSCTCHEPSIAEGDGIVRVSLDTKGRKGKGVTLIRGVLLLPTELKKLAKEIKQKCGVGGAVKNGDIEIQGDHRDQVIAILKDKKYQVKKSGG